jgi:Flp pilus assembly pilin Flp
MNEPSAANARNWRSMASGQGLAEYALILALIAIVAIAALVLLGAQISSFLSQVGDAI